MLFFPVILLYRAISLEGAAPLSREKEKWRKESKKNPKRMRAVFRGRTVRCYRSY